MPSKKLVIFMPSIEGGGVEKNLFIIGNFLAKKIKNTMIVTADRKYNKNFKNLNIINPKFTTNEKTTRLWKYCLCLFELIKLINNNNNIVVFAFQANFYCAVICKILFNVKLITRSNSSPSGWSKNYLKRIIFKRLFKLIDDVIVNSLEFRKELKTKFNANSQCIYNPLNEGEIIRLSKKKIFLPFFNKNKQLKIINIGRFVDQKDHITLLKGMRELNSLNINFKLLIIGRGINLDKMNYYIKKNNLQKKIKILPFKKNPYPYLKAADLFILTSKFEGLPNVLLESLALKKFVIASDCPTGPSEILSRGKGGILFKIGDYKELTKKILFYIKNKKKCSLMLQYSIQQLVRFNENKNLLKYYRIVKKYTD
tara:strand:+ start:2664 stop:3770 length:1107 start_codon:yes stop_codon:yes gene_type:complete